MASSSIGFDDEARERKKKNDELAAMPSPSRESKARFPEDITLRLAGFKIHSRPAVGQAVWERGGVLFLQAEALLRVTKRDAELGLGPKLG